MIPQHDKVDGMSLRDYFAGQALAGMLAHPEDCGTCEQHAKWCYGYADALIIEREKKPEVTSG